MKYDHFTASTYFADGISTHLSFLQMSDFFFQLSDMKESIFIASGDFSGAKANLIQINSHSTTF